jgi:hypothetical protein
VSSGVSKTPAASAPTAGSVITTLQDRLEMYRQAHATAKASNDPSKAKRMERGLQVCVLEEFVVAYP